MFFSVFPNWILRTLTAVAMVMASSLALASASQARSRVESLLNTKFGGIHLPLSSTWTSLKDLQPEIQKREVESLAQVLERIRHPKSLKGLKEIRFTPHQLVNPYTFTRAEADSNRAHLILGASLSWIPDFSNDPLQEPEYTQYLDRNEYLTARDQLWSMRWLRAQLQTVLTNKFRLTEVDAVEILKRNEFNEGRPLDEGSLRLEKLRTFLNLLTRITFPKHDLTGRELEAIHFSTRGLGPRHSRSGLPDFERFVLTKFSDHPALESSAQSLFGPFSNRVVTFSELMWTPEGCEKESPSLQIMKDSRGRYQSELILPAKPWPIFFSSDTTQSCRQVTQKVVGKIQSELRNDNGSLSEDLILRSSIKRYERYAQDRNDPQTVISLVRSPSQCQEGVQRIAREVLEGPHPGDPRVVLRSLVKASPECSQNYFSSYLLSSIALFAQADRFEPGIAAAAILLDELKIGFLNRSTRERLGPNWLAQDSQGAYDYYGAYDCSYSRIWIDAELAPWDLAAAFEHELDHLFRDKDFDLADLANRSQWRRTDAVAYPLAFLKDFLLIDESASSFRAAQKQNEWSIIHRWLPASLGFLDPSGVPAQIQKRYGTTISPLKYSLFYPFEPKCSVDQETDLLGRPVCTPVRDGDFTEAQRWTSTLLSKVGSAYFGQEMPKLTGQLMSKFPFSSLAGFDYLTQWKEGFKGVAMKGSWAKMQVSKSLEQFRYSLKRPSPLCHELSRLNRLGLLKGYVGAKLTSGPVVLGEAGLKPGEAGLKPSTPLKPCKKIRGGI